MENAFGVPGLAAKRDQRTLKRGRQTVESVRRRLFAHALWFGICVALGCLPPLDAEQRIDAKPPEWQVHHWLNSPPLTRKDLCCKIVLVRWWTSPGCPYSKATAPALNEFYKSYHAQGLKVVGFYPHKPGAPVNVESVAKASEKFCFKFPVAINSDWNAKARTWLSRDCFGSSPHDHGD